MFGSFKWLVGKNLIKAISYNTQTPPFAMLLPPHTLSLPPYNLLPYISFLIVRQGSTRGQCAGLF